MKSQLLMHRHHLLPKHMGGSDDPSNIIKVNVAMHAFLHHQLYLEHGKVEDYMAWQGLLKNLTNDEMIIERSKLGGHTTWNNHRELSLSNLAKGRGAPNQRKAARRSVSAMNSRQVECPHCGKVGGETNMRRYHFTNCKAS